MRFWFELGESLRMAVEAIRANKLRSTLTTLGVVIGVTTVTLMGTALDGLNRAFRESVGKLGVDTLYISRTGWFVESYEDWLRLSKRRPITLREAWRLEKEAVGVRAVAPMAKGFGTVVFGDRSARNVAVIGTTDQMFRTGGVGVQPGGRFFSREESDGARPVCVLGADVATNLFPRVAAVGHTVKVNGHPFQVVGVLERQGTFMGAFSLDNQIVIPMGQFISHFQRQPELQIQVRVWDAAGIEEAREEIRGLMRRIRRLAPGEPDDFAINQQEEIARTLRTVSATIAGAGLFITGLSLFVGGIGIMNIMFVSVTERTREIGLRKAVGAKRRSILVQFLLEAAAICLLGGFIALGIAWPATWLLQQFMPARLSPWLALLALGVAALTGILAGFLPAWRAARMDPVEALRHE